MTPSFKPGKTQSGAWFKSANGEQGTVDAIKVENVVDTVGAGDGFALMTTALTPRER
jgi:sugar/nucleoside kinase (ribokinase family)